jgi:hypothetical protein
MTAPRLCELENWPHPKNRRRPTPRVLALLAEVYGTDVHSLLDLDDRQQMPPADQLLIGKIGRVALRGHNTANPVGDGTCLLDGGAEAGRRVQVVESPVQPPARLPRATPVSDPPWGGDGASEDRRWGMDVVAWSSDSPRAGGGAVTGADAPAALTLDALRGAAVAFRTADRRLGGGDLYPVVVGFLGAEVLPHLVGHGHSPAAVFAAASSLTDLAGWLAHDDDRADRADRHFTQAFGLATAAGDQALAAQSLASRSHLALEDGRDADAARLAAAGLALAPAGPGCAPLRTRLLALQARAAALAGDEAACTAALRCAEREHRSAGSGAADGHEWLSPFDDAALAAETATCMRELGRLDEAERHAGRALDLRGPDRVRSRAFSRLTLAGVRLARGELDAACALGGMVLDVAPRLASHRVAAHLRSLGRSLRAHADAAPVGVFLDGSL